MTTMTSSQIPYRTVRWFIPVLSVLLLGYAIAGRGFAYLGASPLFVGEAALALGLLALLSAGSTRTLLARPLPMILAVFMVWSALSTIPHLTTYRVAALRDAAFWGYALFAFIVAGLIVRWPDLLREWLVRYRTFALVFTAVAWLAFIIAEQYGGLFNVPGSGVEFFSAKGGDLLVHMAGAAAFTLIGFSDRPKWVYAFLALDVVVIMVSNRGGMVAFAFAMLVLVVVQPPKMRLLPFVYGGVVVMLTLILVDPRIQIDDRRTISLDQFKENLVSVVGNSGTSQLENTKTWRLTWWSDIVEYTVFGPYFMFGKGYGINLATDDGFQVNEDESLRSPHNATMTVLARSGVPGVALWLLLLVTWYVTLFRNLLHARHRKRYTWVSIHAFLMAYVMAFLVNASFDVFLEGPMGGIWFWCLMGLGMAVAELYRTQPDLFIDALEGASS